MGIFSLLIPFEKNKFVFFSNLRGLHNCDAGVAIATPTRLIYFRHLFRRPTRSMWRLYISRCISVCGSMSLFWTNDFLSLVTL